MSIYKINGTGLSEAYAKDGAVLTGAYDIDGTQDYRKSLRIMEYNVGGWYDGSGSNVPAANINTFYDLHAETITDNDPDVILINEYWEEFSDTGYQAMSFLRQFYPYVYGVPYSDKKSMGRAICSKYPISDYTNHIYLGYSPRYYDTMQMTVGGKTITLCVTHLGLTSEERAAQAAELVAFLQLLQMPFICAGDLNTAKSATTSSDDYVGVIQPLLDAGFHIANMGDFGRMYTYKNTEQGNGALDNIIVSSDIAITNAYVSNEKEEATLPTQIDHMPLVADIEI